MAGFLYYIPGRNGVVDGLLEQVGLSDRLLRPTSCGTNHGPDGGRGVVLCEGGDPPRVRFDAAKQVWTPGTEPGSVTPDKAAPGVYVGRWNDEVIRPADLLRPRALSGHRCVLEDGQEWIVPVLSARFGGGTIPGVLGLDAATGAWVRKPAARHRRVCEIGDRLFEHYLRAIMAAARPEPGAEAPVETPGGSGGSGGLTVQDAVEMAAAILAVNYRVTATELALLEVLPVDADSLFAEDGLFGLALDLPAALSIAREVAKKNEAAAPAGCATSAGAAATTSAGATSPPTPT